MDEVRIMRPPLAAVLERLLGNEELTPAVQVEDLVEEFRGHLGLLTPHLHARVGDDVVDAAEIGHSLLKEASDLGRLGDVRLARPPPWSPALRAPQPRPRPTWSCGRSSQRWRRPAYPAPGRCLVQCHGRAPVIRATLPAKGLT